MFTDTLEFSQNKIKQLNKKFNVEMCHTKICGGKNQLIKNAAENINKTVSVKYGITPENIEAKSLDRKEERYFQEVYDFVRLRKVQDNQMRLDKYKRKIDRRKRTLRSPLNLTEKVLVLAERLKKDASGRL